MSHGYCNKSICASCGLCVYLSGDKKAEMLRTQDGYKPNFTDGTNLPPQFRKCCPGKGINYPKLYSAHYGKLPNNALTGIIEKVRTGYASDPAIRLAGASGGVLTRTLQFLLETNRVDGILLAKQGVPSPMEASAVLATTAEEVLSASGSVYIAVPILMGLRLIDPSKRYAIVCTPEGSAALRALQQKGDPSALAVKYVVGPYTGTALTPQALEYYLKSNKVPKSDSVTSVKWRAGKWPGYLEIKTQSGRILKSPKVYYNFLIPFFVTTTSLLSMDFCNEFADLAVGDAWSPKFENADEGGVSVVVTRNKEMESIIKEMQEKGLLSLTDEDPSKAMDMHGHMIDFKKRGGYLRCQMRKLFFMPAPYYGYKPKQIVFSRRMVELVISSVFSVCRTRLARSIVCMIPEKILGPFFNKARLTWKAASRPTKRKGLAKYEISITSSQD